jgi:hypothetical protein
VTSYQTVQLARGAHKPGEKKACVMELASMLAHEPFSDHPECACPAISRFLLGFNDWLEDDERHVLFDYAARVIGSRDDSAFVGRAEYFCGLAHEFAYATAAAHAAAAAHHAAAAAHHAAAAHAAIAAAHAAAADRQWVIDRCLSALDDLLPAEPQVPAIEIDRAIKELAAV